MKKYLMLCAFLATTVAVCLVTADERSKPAGERPAAKGAAAAAPGKTSPTRVASTAGMKEPGEGGPVHELGAKIVKAFNHRDAAAFAAAFTTNGEYTDENGASFHGRAAIEAEFTALFAAQTGMKIHVQLGMPRLIAPGVAAAEGETQFVHAAGSEPVVGKCSIVCAKEGDDWRIASLREAEAAGHHPAHHDQVGQLEWLVGEWISEGSAYHVHFSCRWDETHNYLLRDFSVQVAGEKASSGTQRIGYDALADHLKAWVFDSSGGFSDGHFRRDGDRWILHLSGVTADGRMASGTNILTRIDDHRIEWQALDGIIDGERITNSGKITIVRKPPAPAARTR